MQDDATLELAAASYGVQFAVIAALIEQGVVDRVRLVHFFQSLVDGLSDEEKRQPYGMTLARFALMLGGDTPPKPPERPDWLRGIIDGGREPGAGN